MEVTYKIIRSAKRRKLTITVERDGTVVVHAPEGMTDEKIRLIVETKRQWIYEKTGHTQKYHSLPHGPGKELASGESILYLGRQYRIEIVGTGLDRIHFSQRFLIPDIEGEGKAEALREWYLERAKTRIIPRAIMRARSLGVDAGSIKIVHNHYRWGSCTVNDNVNLNWRLIKAPMFVIDYVIVHELAHLIEPNHTPRLWNIVRTQIAATEKAKNWLKEHGQLLEEAI